MGANLGNIGETRIWVARIWVARIDANERARIDANLFHRWKFCNCTKILQQMRIRQKVLEWIDLSFF
jgi:hypothetical protein